MMCPIEVQRNEKRQGNSLEMVPAILPPLLARATRERAMGAAKMAKVKRVKRPTEASAPNDSEGSALEEKDECRFDQSRSRL